MVKIVMTLLIMPLSVLAQIKEAWMDRPQNQWPAIAMINNIQFKNGDRYIHSSFPYAGTGFLVNIGPDTVAVTAKHILLVARNRNTSGVSVNKDLLYWSMKPKNSYTDSVLIDRLMNEDTAEVIEGSNSTIFERDMLVLTVKNSSKNIQPLRPRYYPVREGEKVYLLSCAYPDAECTVTEGTVRDKLGFDILINTAKPMLPGASGAAVIDENGMLVGVFSTVSHDNKSNTDVAVAISTEYLQNVLRRQSGLNVPKKDYGELIVDITLKRGATAAIEEYNKLSSYPHMYYIYNFRSANRNGLREAGEKLLQMNRVDDAIEILEYNATVNNSYFQNFNVLARAYLKAGNKNEAMSAFRISVQKNSNRIENEAVRELEYLENNR